MTEEAWRLAIGDAGVFLDAWGARPRHCNGAPASFSTCLATSDSAVSHGN